MHIRSRRTKMQNDKKRKLSRNGFDAFEPELFKTPPTSAYPVYAWVWNDTITPEGIRSQLDDFERAGIKGIYVLAEPKNFRPEKQRTPLEPDYLSDEYIGLLTLAYSCAAGKVMALWLYDEGGWPSGGACGLVRKQYPDAAAKVLTPRKLTLPAGVRYLPKDDVLAAFAGGTRISAGFNAEADTDLTEYFAAEYLPNDNFVNLIDEKAVDAFLDITFGAFEKLPRELLDNISLCFTDEPRLMMPAWADGFGARFMARYRYDLRDWFPAVCGGAKTTAEERAVADYNEFCRDEFDRVFFKKYAARCEKTGVYLGGHLDKDNTLSSGIMCGYADRMPILRTFGIPGIDVIWRQIFPGPTVDPEYDGIDFYPRFASSAAVQSGGILALSESFSVYGDGVTPDQMRYVMNYQLIRGINVFNFMSLPYGRKRGLALCMRPALCPEKPGFYNMHDFYRTCARECYLSQIGDRICDTALYVPSEAAVNRRQKAAYKSFIALGKELEELGIDFDLINADGVRDATESDGCLRLGRAVYRHVIIPENSEAPIDVIEKAARYPGRGEPLATRSNKALRVSARRYSDGRIYTLFNESTEPIADEIMISDRGNCCLLDVRSGHLIERSADSLKVSLAPGETVFFLFTEREIATDKEELPELRLSSPVFLSARRFEVTPDGVSSREADESETRLEEFSGEVSYEFDVSCAHSIGRFGAALLELDLHGCTAGVSIDGETVATLAGTLSTALIPLDRLTSGKLTLTLANTAANEIAAKSDVFASWDDIDYNLYHPQTIVFERDSLFKIPDPKEIIK